MPSAPHDARTRGEAKVLLLNSLRKDIGTLTQLSWTEHGVWSSLASVTTRAKTLGFVVPSWVETMQKVTAILILRIDLHTHFDSQKNPANCDLTHILNKYSSSCTDPYLREVPRGGHLWQTTGALVLLGDTHCNTERLNSDSPRTIFGITLGGIATPVGSHGYDSISVSRLSPQLLGYRRPA